MNPTVLICTHNRLEITSYNIESLNKQSVKPKIILVVSNLEEKIYYSRKFPEIQLLVYPNVPLGAKWQHGVDYAYELKADPLIILGSDDILGAGFIEKCCDLVAFGHDFVGLKHWYIHYKGRAYYCLYMAKQPLGGARSYSYALLQKLEGKLFSTQINRHLDDFAILKTKTLGIEPYEDSTLEVHAVKGDWPVMNPVNLTHANIKVLKIYDSSTLLPDLYLNS